MTALTSGRVVPQREGSAFSRRVAAGAKIQNGSLIVLNAARFARPGYVATGLIADGIARATVDNTSGADGDLRVRVEPGNFPFANSASGDLIVQADIGNPCYIVDDQTVAKTDGGGTRSKAGTILDIDQAGVWVGVGILHP